MLIEEVGPVYRRLQLEISLLKVLVEQADMGGICGG
jgi:hypothetical protein